MPLLSKEKTKKSKKSSKIDSSQNVPHILPSIIKVGGDSNSNLGSAVKSSTTFLSSPLGKIRRSKSKRTKKSDSNNGSSIKIQIRPGMIGAHSIVSSNKDSKSSSSSSQDESGSESSSSRTSSSIVPTNHKFCYENGLFMMQYPPGFYIHPLLQVAERQQ
jgi:hypothetical protein